MLRVSEPQAVDFWTAMTPMDYLGPITPEGYVQWRTPQPIGTAAIGSMFDRRQLTLTTELTAPALIDKRLAEGFRMMGLYE